MEKILGIYGVGGGGREVLDLAHEINSSGPRWKEIVFIDDGEVPPIVNGVKVYKYEQAVEKYQSCLEIIIGIGEPSVREKLYRKIQQDKIAMATLIHPSVQIPDTTFIGRGVSIKKGSVVSCNVTIKDNSYIQWYVMIGHDCVLEEGTAVSSLCNIAGGTHIGKYTYIGMSTCIRECVSIGDNSIISMASAVYNDIPAGVIALGNPARPMKKNTDRNVFKH